METLDRSGMSEGAAAVCESEDWCGVREPFSGINLRCQ